MTIRATQAGLIMGTAGYMSPEQAAGKTVDKRADIWAFGVVLHELLTGKKLFHGETVSHTLASVLKDPIDLAIPQAPKPIQALLARCLDRNLKHRLKDIGEARIAIENFLANPKPQEAANQAPKPTLWIAVAATLLLALVAAVLWPRSTPPVTRTGHFNFSGSGGWILVSPDGRWLLKLAHGEFQVRRMDQPNWLKLRGTEGALRSSAFWSQDSSSIGFVSADRLRIVPLDDTPARDLMAVQDFRGASWRGGRDNGTILLATNGKLKTFDLRSGTSRDLTHDFKADSPPLEPVFLPEGDGFVFLKNRENAIQLFRSALNSSAIDPLLLTSWRVNFAKHPSTGKWHIFYLDGKSELLSSRILQTAQVDPKSGRLISTPVKLLQGISTNAPPVRIGQFSVGDGGVLSWVYFGNLPIWHFVWIDSTGTLLAKVSENRNYISMALSPDESRIAAQVDDPDSHIWILGSKTGLGGRISTTSAFETNPRWALDGKSLFYTSSWDNRPAIMRYFLDSATKPELIWQPSQENRDITFLLVSGVSPEGRYLLLQTRIGSLSRLDLQAAEPRKLEHLTEQMGVASLSLDGRSIAWGNSSEGGLAVQAYPTTSEPMKRFLRGAEKITYPFFSPDGRTVYAQLNRNLLAFPFSLDRSLGEPKVLRPWLTSGRRGATAGAASRDGKRLLLLETDEEEILNPQVLTDWTTLFPK